MVLRKRKDEFDDHRDTSLAAHATKILLKIIASCFSEYCERMGILPEEQSGLRPNHSITGMMFVIRRVKELAWKTRTSLYVCFIDLTKPYDSVDRTLLWTVLARFIVPQKTILVIRQFHGDIPARVRVEDGVCSGGFTLKQGLRKGYVLAPLLFNISSRRL